MADGAWIPDAWSRAVTLAMDNLLPDFHIGEIYYAPGPGNSYFEFVSCSHT